MIYRRMTADDIDGVYEVELSAFEDPWSYSALRGELKNKLSRYIVAEDDDGRTACLLGACGDSLCHSFSYGSRFLL